MKDVVAVDAGEYRLDGNMLAKAAIALIDRQDGLCAADVALRLALLRSLWLTAVNVR